MLVETRYLRQGSSAEALSALSLQKLIEVIIVFITVFDVIKSDVRFAGAKERI